MRKFMYVEIIIILILLIVSIVVCASVTKDRVYTPELPEQPAGNQAQQPNENPADPTDPQQTDPTTDPPTEPGPTWMTVAPGRELLAQQYFVYDCKTDTFVTSSATPDERVYPASVTKLFTAYVALQYVQPDQQITAGDALDMVAWGSSVAELKKGDTLTAEQLVEAMLLPSGNDAAYVLAAEVGRIIDNNPNATAVAAVMTFMREMNSQAQEVGMTGTHFVNPDGIHSSDHYMSYADLCLLGELALKNETIMKYAKVASDKVTLSEGEVKWENTNKIINPESEYYCPYAIGLKTGQTPTAGSCLLSAFRMNGQEWIIGVFGCPEETDRFDDTIQLFNQTIEE